MKNTVILFFLSIFVSLITFSNCMNHVLNIVDDNFREGGFSIEGTSTEKQEIRNMISEMLNSGIYQYVKAINTISDKGTIIKIDHNLESSGKYLNNQNIILLKKSNNTFFNRSTLFHEILHLEQDIIRIVPMKTTLDFKNYIKIGLIYEFYTHAYARTLYANPIEINDISVIKHYFNESYNDLCDWYFYRYIEYLNSIENNLTNFNYIYVKHRKNSIIKKVCEKLNKLSKNYNMPILFDYDFIINLSNNESVYWNRNMYDEDHLLNGEVNNMEYLFNTVDKIYNKKLDEDASFYWRYPEGLFNDF